MMDLKTIRYLADEQAKKAAREKRVPYAPFDADEVENYPAFPFPNIGSHRPKGWKLVDSLFVDKSGFGSENEPALTIRGLKAKLLEQLQEGYGYAIIEEGQFQLSLGVFKKTGRKP